VLLLPLPLHDTGDCYSFYVNVDPVLTLTHFIVDDYCYVGDDDPVCCFVMYSYPDLLTAV